MRAVACGEYISVASQRDAEAADVDKEKREQEKGPAAQQKELEELTQIYIDRCVDVVHAPSTYSCTHTQGGRAHFQRNKFSHNGSACMLERE